MSTTSIRRPPRCGHCGADSPGTQAPGQQTDDAIRTLHIALGQWATALRKGLNPDQFRDVLLADLESCQVALATVTDYLIERGE